MVRDVGGRDDPPLTPPSSPRSKHVRMMHCNMAAIFVSCLLPDFQSKDRKRSRRWSLRHHEDAYIERGNAGKKQATCTSTLDDTPFPLIPRASRERSNT
mmetsp:Transcript_7254/g.14330  ORF Transcript_7254/g.14330 Transcript_7254/m.14330 type:complete len:99 (+) Transcript_7254:2147-2443(+)